MLAAVNFEAKFDKLPVCQFETQTGDALQAHLRAQKALSSKRITSVGELMDPTSGNNTPLQSPRLVLVNKVAAGAPGTPSTPQNKRDSAGLTANEGGQVFFGDDFAPSPLMSGLPPPASVLTAASAFLSEGDLASPGTPRTPASPACHAGVSRKLVDQKRKEVACQLLVQTNTWFPSRMLSKLCTFVELELQI